MVLLLRGRLENVISWDSDWCGFVIQALDVDKAEPRPDGPDRQEDQVRVPTKPAMHSNLKPAGYSDRKPATLGVNRMGRFDDVVGG